MNLSYYITGAVTVSVPWESATPFLDLCLVRGAVYTDFLASEEGISLTLRLSPSRGLLREAEARGISFEVVKRRGIPVLFSRYRFRFGIPLGILLATLLVFFAGRVVWDIRIEGNERISSAAVRQLLADQGVRVGSYIPALNTDRIENRILLSTDQISWISVNLVGNVAEVQIREREAQEVRQRLTLPANLVAKKSGLVEEVRIFRGKVMVSAGKTVEKGDLLVSGLYDSRMVGFRYTRASGQVMARVTDEYFIEIPYEYDTIVYTGEEYCDKSLNFFGFSINFSKNSGKEGVLYDKIDIVENYCLLEGISSPLELRTTRYLAYRQVTARRSVAEAQELAYFELERRLGSIAEGGVILRKTVTATVGEDSFLLYCVVVSVEDIAMVSEFEVDLSLVGE